jgi:hypothetical protein
MDPIHPQPMLLRYETTLIVPPVWTGSLKAALKVGLAAAVVVCVPAGLVIGLLMGLRQTYFGVEFPAFIVSVGFLWRTVFKRYLITRDGVEPRPLGPIYMGKPLRWSDVHEVYLLPTKIIIYGHAPLQVPTPPGFGLAQRPLIARLWRQSLRGSGRRTLCGFRMPMSAVRGWCARFLLLISVAAFFVGMWADQNYQRGDFTPIFIVAAMALLAAAILFKGFHDASVRGWVTLSGLTWRGSGGWRVLPWDQVGLIHTRLTRGFTGVRLVTSDGALRFGFWTFSGDRIARKLAALVQRARRRGAAAEEPGAPSGRHLPIVVKPTERYRLPGDTTILSSLAEIAIVTGSLVLLYYFPLRLPHTPLGLMAYLLAAWLPLPALLALRDIRRERRILRHTLPTSVPQHV